MKGPAWRDGAPSGGSTLMTSAPNCAKLQPGQLAGRIGGQLDDRESVGYGRQVGVIPSDHPPVGQRRRSRRRQTKDVPKTYSLSSPSNGADRQLSGRERAKPERHALEPGLADDRMVELEEHVAVGDLRVVFVDILCVLHRAGAHARGL